MTTLRFTSWKRDIYAGVARPEYRRVQAKKKQLAYFYAMMLAVFMLAMALVFLR